MRSHCHQAPPVDNGRHLLTPVATCCHWTSLLPLDATCCHYCTMTSLKISLIRGHGSTIGGRESTLCGLEFTLHDLESTLRGLESTIRGLGSTIGGRESTLCGLEFTLRWGLVEPFNQFSSVQFSSKLDSYWLTCGSRFYQSPLATWRM
jgi:hypothetical protein